MSAISSGLGSPIAIVSLISQNATIGTTAILTSPPAGLYLVTVYLSKTTAGTSGTVLSTISFTDDSAANTTVTGTLTFGTTGSSSITAVVQVASGNISYATTVAANVGGVYSLKISVMRVL